MWANAAYPSLKPLSSWVKDLVLRLHFINVGLNLFLTVLYVHCLINYSTGLDMDTPNPFGYQAFSSHKASSLVLFRIMLESTNFQSMN